MNSDQTSNAQKELISFVSRFLENHGSAVEKKEDAWDALLPEDLAKSLETPEHIQFSATGDGKSIHSINFGSSLLDRMIGIACAEAPLLSCKLDFDYLKTQGFDRLVNEQFSLNGAVTSVENWAKINTEYLLVTCRYLAQSDEQKEGLVSVILNLESGAYVPDMLEQLDIVTKNYGVQRVEPSWDQNRIDRIMSLTEKNTAEKINLEIWTFKESMNRRFRRDVLNMEEYYASLRKEMEESLKRPGISQQNIEDRQSKIDLLPDELSRKKDDLFKKYSIKIKIEPAALMWIKTPAVKVLLKTMVGRKRLDMSAIYNPVTKQIDPLVCQGCGKSITSVFFCEHLHALCVSCRTSCRVCAENPDLKKTRK